jgi:hypothetical protein
MAGFFGRGFDSRRLHQSSILTNLLIYRGVATKRGSALNVEI